MQRIPVCVQARDSISEAGVASQLRPSRDVHVLASDDVESARVAVVVVDSVDEDALQMLRMIRRSGTARTVLVASRLDDRALVTAVESGVVGLVRRTEATPARLVKLIKAADCGEGSVPPDLLARLLEQVGELQRQVLSPRGLTFNGLAAREIEVLRLVADGYDTAEIAVKLAYSERTIKNVLHDVMSRLQLRNRSHAVAFALRQGLI